MACFNIKFPPGIFIKSFKFDKVDPVIDTTFNIVIKLFFFSLHLKVS